MKKILLFFLAITLFVCCVGCGSSDNKIVCSACGEAFEETIKFCPNCGESLNVSQTNNGDNNESNQNNSTSNTNQNNGNKILTSTNIIKCLQKVPCIIEIEAVTEDNDPIGQLNKPGGYTALVYFSYALVDQQEVYGDDLIDKGTDAGGCIEVYTTEKDANKRNEYLAAFDGGVLSSGSHKVVGTCVIRTSDELTISQQQLLESNIIFALQGDNDKIVNPNGNSNNATVSAIGEYTNAENHTLTIFNGGTLYLSFNGDYSDLEGTWSQNGDIITYSVWDEYGEWNNPFEDKIYKDGIDFLGEYYTRID